MKVILTLIITGTICATSGCVSNEVIMQRERLEHERKMQEDKHFHELTMEVHVQKESLPYTLREDENGNILIKNESAGTEYILDFDKQTLTPKEN